MGTLTKWLALVVVFLCPNILAMENSENTSEQKPENKVETPFILTQSLLDTSGKGANNAFAAALKAAQDAETPVISTIVDFNDCNMWETMVILAFKNNAITEADLLWVLKEYAEPNFLKDNGPELLFNLVIKNHFAHESSLLTDLLTKITIDIANPWLVGSYYYTRNEKRSTVAEMIERSANNPGYLKAFQEILNLLSVATVETAKVVSREEYVKRDEKSFFDYKYEMREYTLVGWLMREKAKWLNKKNMHYIDVANLIIKKKLADNGDIDESLFDMVTHLKTIGNNEKTPLIDDNIYKQVASRYKDIKVTAN